MMYRYLIMYIYIYVWSPPVEPMSNQFFLSYVHPILSMSATIGQMLAECSLDHHWGNQRNIEKEQKEPIIWESLAGPLGEGLSSKPKKQKKHKQTVCVYIYNHSSYTYNMYAYNL
jgi:hypothetical protein